MTANAPPSTDLNSTSQLNRLEHAFNSQVQANWENIISVIIFIATIAFFTVAAAWSAATNQMSISQAEKRTLAPFPGLHTVKKDLPKFAQGFEKFYNDRFAFRLPLVAARNFVLLEALNSSGHNQVVIGKNGWLFYVAPQAIAAQANLEPFTETNLEKWAAAIQSRKNFLAAHGIKYLFVIPPEKGSIFPENLPSRLQVAQGKTRLDQLQDYLRAHTDVDFVDAKGLLLKAKRGQFPLYHKPDTHWNQYGSFLVTQEMLKHIHAYFPAVEPFSIFDYKLTTDYPFYGDLAKMLGLGELFAERTMCVLIGREKAHIQKDASVAPVADCWVPSFAWVGPDSALPRLFVLRDSFCGYLIPFLAEKSSFSEFHWNHRLLASLVLAQKPDLFVDEMAERHLYDYEPENVPQFVLNKADSHSGVKPLAIFENTFELKNVDVQRSKTGMVVHLHWRSLSQQLLNRHIGLHAMSASGVVLASADCDQDAFQRVIPAFSEWTDTVEIPRTSRLKIAQLGLYLHSDDGNCMSAVAARTNWGTARVLLSLKDLEARNAH